MGQSTPRSVVIVGAGAGGLVAAQRLRAEDYRGPITIISAERGRPYDRPPLSKQVLAGSWSPERADLMSPRRLESLNARWAFSAARSLDVSRCEVSLEDGRRLGYDALIIATGVAPRRLAGTTRRGVFVLRTLTDAIALRSAIRRGRRLVVIGGGFLGLEVAATARLLGADVVVVEPLSQPLASRLGDDASAKLLMTHQHHGVHILPGVGATALLSGRGCDERVTGVELSTGDVIDADTVLVAIGCRPNTDWLGSSGLSVDDGIVCDEYCRAAENVWAAGDVARWNHPGLGQRLRVEHRMNANEQGDVVARNVLGAALPFSPIPFFWTDHFDVKVQVLGIVPANATPILREGSVESDTFVIAFKEGGVVRGLLGWNAPRSVLRYREEIAAGLAGPLPRGVADAAPATAYEARGVRGQPEP